MDRDRGSRGFSRRKHFLIAPVLLALLLPIGPLFAEELFAEELFAEECEASTREPLVLRDQRIPFYEVFETFLLHAGIIHETQGQDAYRAFLLEYGLDPELEAFQELRRAFDDLERALYLNAGEAEHETARRAGEVFARVLAAIVENDSRGVEAAREFRLRLGTQLRPAMSWIFLDGSPDFSVVDEAEECFYESLGPVGESIQFRNAGTDSAGAHAIELKHGPAESSAQASRVKLSSLQRGDGGLFGPGEEHLPAGQAEVEWRRYARADGSVRVVGFVDSGAGPLGVVDMTFPTGHHLRPEFNQQGTDGVLRFVETFPVDAQGKSHTSAGCLSAAAAAGVACGACTVAPSPITCGACAAALAVMGAACSGAHCDQIQCNYNCVQACHLYGICSSTSGSSTPADCQCVGIRDDIPGCGGGGGGGGIGCDSMVNEVSVLHFDGGDPVRLSTGPVTLSRLERGEEMHHGEEVSYLMGEWAVLAQATPTGFADSALSVRTLRSSSPEFAASQAYQLRANPVAAAGGSSAAADRIAIVVATPPHEANSREIPMPALRIAPAGLLPGAASGKIAIRADFSEAGDLVDLEILHDTLGGVSAQLAAHIKQALSLQHVSEKRHRVVAFAVLSVGESLEIDSKLLYLPKCCCGNHFCV